AMLAGAAPDQGEGSAIPAGSQPTPDPIPSTTTLPPIFEPQPSSPPSAEDSLQLKELMAIVPQLVLRIDNLEKELQQTKSTYGKAVLTLVERVKFLEAALKRKSKKVILSESEDEETEDQRRKIQDIDDDPLVSLVRDSMKEKEAYFVTPKKVSALGEAQEEDISPTTLEAAKTLSNVASQSVSTYMRRARSTSKSKDIDTCLDFFSAAKEKINSAKVEVSSGRVEVNPSIKSQREGKAPMTSEDVLTTQKTKEQIRQEEAGLAEAMRLQALQDEEDARQVYLDALLAKRKQEEQELSEQQQRRKAEVQKAAQYYTEEDWNTIRAKLEANAELTKNLQGENVSSNDFAKRMVDMINQKKKFYAEQKAKAKRDKPMTQAQQRDYMSTFIKNQSSWKMVQLKKLTFEELKVKFEKLMKSIESFVPMGSEERVKRVGVQLEQESSKKQKIVVEDVPVIEEKVEVVKKEEPIKRTEKRKKQKARKGIHVDKTAQYETEKEREAHMKDKVSDPSSSSDIGIDVIPTATKPPSIVNWKIIPQPGQKAVYQIIRRDGSNKIYMSFGAMLKDISRDDLIELYRLVIQNEDAIWSWPLQQKMRNLRYYGSCAVHCLTLDASAIYMLADLSKYACQAMLNMKLQGGVKDEVCYQLLKMIEKQAGLR
ncbi:hypothetical protein Tco_0240522, partial [Tanacetum coccineum]